MRLRTLLATLLIPATLTGCVAPGPGYYGPGYGGGYGGPAYGGYGGYRGPAYAGGYGGYRGPAYAGYVARPSYGWGGPRVSAPVARSWGGGGWGGGGRGARRGRWKRTRVWPAQMGCVRPGPPL